MKMKIEILPMIPHPLGSKKRWVCCWQAGTNERYDPRLMNVDGTFVREWEDLNVFKFKSHREIIQILRQRYNVYVIVPELCYKLTIKRH